MRLSFAYNGNKIVDICLQIIFFCWSSWCQMEVHESFSAPTAQSYAAPKPTLPSHRLPILLTL